MMQECPAESPQQPGMTKHDNVFYICASYILPEFWAFAAVSDVLNANLT